MHAPSVPTVAASSKDDWVHYDNHHDPNLQARDNEAKLARSLAAWALSIELCHVAVHIVMDIVEAPLHLCAGDTMVGKG